MPPTFLANVLRAGSNAVVMLVRDGDGGVLQARGVALGVWLSRLWGEAYKPGEAYPEPTLAVDAVALAIFLHRCNGGSVA